MGLTSYPLVQDFFHQQYAIKIAMQCAEKHFFPVGPGTISRFGWSYCSMSKSSWDSNSHIPNASSIFASWNGPCTILGSTFPCPTHPMSCQTSILYNNVLPTFLTGFLAFIFSCQVVSFDRKRKYDKGVDDDVNDDYFLIMMMRYDVDVGFANEDVDHIHES